MMTYLVKTQVSHPDRLHSIKRAARVISAEDAEQAEDRAIRENKREGLITRYVCAMSIGPSRRES